MRLIKPKATIGIFLACIVLFAGCMVYVVRHLNKPAVGVVRHVQPAGDTNASGTLKTLDTAYYATDYAANFTLMPKPTASASLDAEMLAGKQDGDTGTSSHIALTVIALPVGGVTEDSSYHLFSTHPQTYTMARQTTHGDSLVVATKSHDGYEKIYLWPHGTYLLTIDMTTSAQSSDIDTQLTSIVQSLHWKDAP